MKEGIPSLKDDSVRTELYYTRDYNGTISELKEIDRHDGKVVLQNTHTKSFEIKEAKELFNSKVEAAQDYVEYWVQQLERDVKNMGHARQKLEEVRKETT